MTAPIPRVMPIRNRRKKSDMVGLCALVVRDSAAQGVPFGLTKRFSCERRRSVAWRGRHDYGGVAHVFTTSS